MPSIVISSLNTLLKLSLTIINHPSRPLIGEAFNSLSLIERVFVFAPCLTAGFLLLIGKIKNWFSGKSVNQKIGFLGKGKGDGSHENICLRFYAPNRNIMHRSQHRYYSACERFNMEFVQNITIRTKSRYKSKYSR